MICYYSSALVKKKNKGINNSQQRGWKKPGRERTGVSCFFVAVEAALVARLIQLSLVAEAAAEAFAVAGEQRQGKVQEVVETLLAGAGTGAGAVAGTRSDRSFVACLYQKTFFLYIFF